MFTEIINIDPEIWGPDFWHTIEAVCCTLIPDNKQFIYQFMIGIGNIIPCEKCRFHYREFLKLNPIINYMQNSCTLLSWVYKLKKEIKNRQDKEIVGFDDWIQFISNKYDVPELLYYLKENENFKSIKMQSKSASVLNLFTP